jgi:HEAT repeat protein
MSPRSNWFRPRRTSAPACAPATGQAGGAAPKRRRRDRVVRLMAFVAACAVVTWVLRDWFAPARQWARQLREGTNDEREEAAVQLGRLPVHDASLVLPALTAALGDENERVVINALSSLGKAAAATGNDPASARAALAALVATLKDRREAVRAAVVSALPPPAMDPLFAESATPCADALVAALSDPSEEVRAAAARKAYRDPSRTDTPDPRQLLGPLMKALESDPSPLVRREAALSLGQFRSECDLITVALLHALETGEPAVRDACESALGGLRGNRDPGEERRSAAMVPELIKVLGSHERAARCQAAMVLGELGPSAQDSTSALLALLQEPVDPKVTSERRPDFTEPGTVAARVLGEIAPKTPRAKEVATALTSVLRGDAFEKRREAAAESLSEFSPELAGEAVPLLIAVANEKQGKTWDLFLRSACRALGRLAPGSPSADKAVVALSKALDTRDPDTRAIAAHSLGEFGSQAKSALTRLRALEKDEMPWVENKVVKQWIQDSAKEAIRRIEAP